MLERSLSSRANWIDTDPTSCAQRLAFTGKQKTRVERDTTGSVAAPAARCRKFRRPSR